MKKHTYRAKKVNKINWIKLKEQLAGSKVIFAIDVAKKKQYALLTTEDGSVTVLMYWNHLDQTRELINQLKALECPLDFIMESTGTYGDSLRHQLNAAGFTAYQISTKRVSDAREVFDGVPSMHDAKAATVIAELHRRGLSQAWQEKSEAERTLDAQRREYDMHQSQHQRNQNRLEAYLSRHWPEILPELSLDSVTLEQILIAYGDPAHIATHAQTAAEQMREWSHGMLGEDKIKRIIDAACHTLGAPCLESERQYLQALGRELQHSRLAKKQAKQQLEAQIKADDSLMQMGLMIGFVTTAVLISCNLDPNRYGNARRYQKAFGLNLKETSSGTYQGRLSITKRGSSIARRYLYFAALRLIKDDPVINAWYQRKADSRAKKKTVIALMRKLSKALWHVGRGETFDARKLLTVG